MATCFGKVKKLQQITGKLPKSLKNRSRRLGLNFITLYNMYSVPWKIFSTVGNILNTVGDIFSTAGLFSTIEGYHGSEHKNMGGGGGGRTCIMIFSHGTEHLLLYSKRHFTDLGYLDRFLR